MSTKASVIERDEFSTVQTEGPTMKAIVYRRHGGPEVLQYEEIAKPTPKDDEVLIRIRAASVNPLDWRFMRGGPLVMRALLRLLMPKVKRLGADVAGEIAAVGKHVSELKVGDAVFGVCRGSFAEYAIAPASKIAPKPEVISFEEAASIPVAGLTALQGIRDKASVKPGQRVLVNGAAGGVGTFAVQFAKHFGAEVTAVCSTRNLEMVRGLGADHVIDYTREDFTCRAERFDVVLDCIANRSAAELRRVLKIKGVCIICGGPKKLRLMLSRMVFPLVLNCFVSQTFRFFVAQVNPQDLSSIANLIAQGRVKSVVERRYGLKDVPEAIAYLEEGHARGKVVINVGATQ